MSPATVMAVSVILGVAAAVVVVALVPVVPLACAVALAAGSLPWFVIGWRARVARRATRMVWPDIVDQLVSAARSGIALPDGIAALAISGPVVTRAAFAQFAADYASTGNVGVALDGLKTRLADPVADRIVETLRMSREVGGSELTTVLRNLGAYLRQEGALRSEIEARQSWVTNAARLGVAAPWVVLALLATRPEAAAAYNSAVGVGIVLGGLGVSVVAYRVMIALGRLPEQRRWFA